MDFEENWLIIVGFHDWKKNRVYNFYVEITIFKWNQDIGKGEHLFIAMGVHADTATIEIIMEVSQKD